MFARKPHHAVIARRGLITPLLAVALLVVLASTALVLDRLWLDSAMTELTGCAEAAALAAAGELADDDLLRTNADPKQRLDAARQAAAEIAAKNYCAGEPVHLDLAADGDVRFGRIVRNAGTGIEQFLETDDYPTSVLVTAWRNRRRSNPVARLFDGWSPDVGADAVQRAEASIDNRIVGVRPFGDVPVPALPLAILKNDATGDRLDTWDAQIEGRAGGDLFGYDAETRRVVARPDGIPEIVLHSMPVGGDSQPSEHNVVLVDLGTGLQFGSLVRQISTGWTARDLAPLGGKLQLNGPLPELTAAAAITSPLPRSLSQSAGQCRICLLYTDYQSGSTTGAGSVIAAGLVAGRIMSVQVLDDSVCRIVLQPCVLTTRTALLADASAGSDTADAPNNRYIYKLHLTY